ncbi:MAG: soluble lytic murein transglycosylase, partial [Candidatus Berkelbacteria bacterium Licking1014_2]
AAMIYTESGFTPEAISPVGARGLMQIMPGTGAGIARDLGVADYNANMLFDPAINIRFGAFYIKGLLNDYGNDLDLALMGYNGGRGAANMWRDYRSVLPRETQGFVRKVKSVRDSYVKIYGADWPKNKPKKSAFEEDVKFFLYRVIFQR